MLSTTASTSARSLALMNVTENRRNLIRRLLAMSKTQPAHHPGMDRLFLLEPDFDHDRLAWKVLSTVEGRLSNGVTDIRLVMEEDALRLEFTLRGDESWGLPPEEVRRLLRDTASDWVLGRGSHASYCDETTYDDEIVFFYAWDLYRVDAGEVVEHVRGMLG